MSAALTLADITVRMANEGVPLRAIARSTKLPPDDVRGIVSEAVASGVLVDTPRDDWPQGVGRHDRSPALQEIGDGKDETLIFHCCRIFNTTRLQSSLFLALIQRNEVSRDTLHQIIENRRSNSKEETDPKIVDVVVCHLRKKLKVLGMNIVTVWGCGYYMDYEDRKRARDMLEKDMEIEAPKPVNQGERRAM